MLHHLFMLPALLALALLGLLPASAALAEATLLPGQTVIVVGTDGRGLRLRDGPGMSHRIITTVAEGASVQVVSGPVSDGDDDWYQVSTQSSAGAATTGWGVSTYLLPTAAVRSLSTDAGPRVFLGRVTAYADGTGGVPVGARTYSGTKTRWGVVAVDPKVIPIGSAVQIEGYDGIFIAEDVGSGIKGEALDIWLPNAADAKMYGTQYRRVTILREGPATSGAVVTAPSTDLVSPTMAPLIPSAAPVVP